jgi:hypothetical protein
MRFFATKTEAARYVTRELLPELGRGCMLTTIIRQGKSGDFFVTSAITNSSGWTIPDPAIYGLVRPGEEEEKED